MPDLSMRITDMEFSPTRKLLPLAEKAKKEGVEVFHLNIGQPDIPSPESFFRALESYKGVEGTGINSYVVSQGLESLRKAFVDYIRLTVENVSDLSAGNCMITMGCSEALERLAFTLFNRGDKVIVPEPYYTNYNSFFGIHDVEIVPYTTGIDDNFSLGDIAPTIKRMVEADDRIRGILITNPNNPTGCVYTERELIGLAKVAEEHDLWLISDEVYREFVYDMEKPRSVLSIESARNNTVVLESVSKRWSSCGCRVGAVFSYNKDLMQNFLKVLQSRLSGSRVDQTAVCAMIESDVRILRERLSGKRDELTEVEKARDEYDRKRRATYDVLKAHGIKCGYPKGALYVVADLGEKNGDPIDAEDFCRFMLEEFRVNKKTVMVTFAGPFYKTSVFGKSQIRIAFVLSPEKMKEAAEILCRGIEEYRKR
ncbi:MAG: pyridoxal phosphate-dependent aminotransferase [Candidatus Aenigmarchaeota archaeon]|nr:pyridoxal phosphate-dependent aminotransferase [Candidatus Aenigmarchaeota archaeon]